MKTLCTWKERYRFDAAFGPHLVPMDAKPPIGGGTATTPKELMLAAITGCSGVDVIGLLRKAKQEPTSFTIAAAAEVAKGHPAIFTKVELIYRTSGAVAPAVLVDAVEKSMTLYCGVSAMVAKVCPITYVIEHEGREIGRGEARFP